MFAFEHRILFTKYDLVHSNRIEFNYLCFLYENSTEIIVSRYFELSNFEYCFKQTVLS